MLERHSWKGVVCRQPGHIQSEEAATNVPGVWSGSSAQHNLGDLSIRADSKQQTRWRISVLRCKAYFDIHASFAQMMSS